MKKYIAIILTIIMCISLIGCGNSQTEKADTLHKTISIVQNNNRNRMVCEDENYIYFFNTNQILKMSKDNDSLETVYTFEGDNWLCFDCIEYYNGAVYMIGFGPEASMGMMLATVKTDGTGMKTVSLGNRNVMPNFSVYGDTLYLGEYRLNPETLEMEETEYKQYFKTSDGYIFTKEVEYQCGRLYKTGPNGNKQLFLNTDKSVFMQHITDCYVFYVLVDPVNFDKFELYRCDIDGNNDMFIREIPLDKILEISHDNKYLYVGEYKGAIWKIDKETLETTDISGIEDIEYVWQEVSNEKFFYCRGGECYYIDTVTGEKVEF